MKSRTHYLTFFSLMFILTCFQVSSFAQTSDDKGRVAGVSGGGLNIRFDVVVPYSSATVAISSPDGQTLRKEFKSGVTPEMALTDAKGERLPDGVYNYEIRVAPVFSSSVKEALAAAREKGNEDEVQRDLRKRGILPTQPTTQSGSFAVINGSIIVPGALEERTGRARAANTVEQPSPIKLIPAGQAKVLRHHMALMAPFDFVIADDLIVQGSGCFGLDCVDGESFGFDTIRVKENNTRIQFDDTSTSAGFATNNWQIRANSSASGGASFLAFVDQGATGNSETGTIVFEVDAGAPANSLRVSSGGNIGVGTATPVLDIHANTTDTPAIRLEQNNSGGFTAQTWDIGANEANFFVRDVTSGSRLPFRIRPGAPTSSLDISAAGNVGINNGSPAALLHVLKDQATGTEIRVSNSNTAGGFAGLYLNGGFTLTTGGFVQYNNVTGQKNLFVATGGADPLHLGTNNAVRMTILSSGLVGIGTQAPTDTLSVSGTASKTGGGSWSVFSDERLKNIRGHFNRGLSAVMQLQPLRFEYKPDNALGLKSETENIGFGAQALQQIVPEAVTKNQNGYLQVNNDPILWTMLNAIKEQQAEILKLQKEVRQLRAASRRRK
ncbi:MAG TPA: tail fiber domain-containing protein [Pyrinomonadaceae bacterium]